MAIAIAATAVKDMQDKRLFCILLPLLMIVCVIIYSSVVNLRCAKRGDAKYIRSIVNVSYNSATVDRYRGHLPGGVGPKELDQTEQSSGPYARHRRFGRYRS